VAIALPPLGDPKRSGLGAGMYEQLTNLLPVGNTGSWSPWGWKDQASPSRNIR
jgi:hypothetical protein